MADQPVIKDNQSVQWLRIALLELIGANGFERVTISELCKKAGVNRGTFYLHYPDKYAFYEALKTTHLNGLEGQFNLIKLEQLITQEKADQPLDFQVALIRYFYEHRDFFRIIFGPNGDPKFLQQIREIISGLLLQKMNMLGNVLEQLPAPPDYLIAYLTNANLGMVKQWLEEGCPFPPEQLARMFSMIVRHGPLSIRQPNGEKVE